MSDLMSRLAALHDEFPSAVGDDVVAADLRRGHAARIVRRRRRTAVAGAATLGVVAAGSLSYAAASSGRSHGSRHDARAVVPHSSTIVPPHTAGPATSAPTPSIALVAYEGKQLPGYTVARVPRGYVLQGVSASVLDIARKGDHSSLDTFVGKLVVMLNDHPGADTGKAVTVNGHPGRLNVSDGVQALTYSDGTNNVEVQSWSDIHITGDELVRFAEGITVLPGAEVGHG